MSVTIVAFRSEVEVPDSEFELTYVRSSGPGGQNVNKVNSKAVLRWNLFKTSSFSEFNKTSLFHRLKSQLTRDGDLIVSSDRFRDQGRNREDCFEKFRQILSDALTPQIERKKTQPTYSSVRKTKTEKNKHSQKKALRKSSRFEE